MKVIIPNGEDIVMSKDIFDQNPKFFMKCLLGSITINRVLNEEAARLEQIFTRPCVKDILAKETYTWQDYQNVSNWCF